MMQIETIILNTSLIQITEKSIPIEFKTYSNATQTPMCNEERSSFGDAKEQRKFKFGAKFAPYFSSFDLPSSSSSASINSRK